MKTNNFARFEYFENQLENLSTCDLIGLYNQYCYAVNNPDSRIYPFDEDWFEMFESKAEAARSVFFGEVENWADEWVTLNGYGNTKTLSDSSARAYILYMSEDIYRYCDFSDFVDMSEYDEAEDEDTEE